MAKIIMFVDDDSAFLTFIERVCMKVDTVKAVLTATDGQDGLDRIKKLMEAHEPLPDVVFVDVNMPRLDGFGFLQGLKSLKEKHPALEVVKVVIMLTSSDQKRDKDKAFVLGASNFIVKLAELSEARKLIFEITK